MSERELIDDRPLAAPDVFSYRTLDECPDFTSFVEAMVAIHAGTVEWQRYTVVAPEHPMPPYPDGWYFEGWSVRPENMKPPHKEAPFAFPLVEPRP